MKLATLIQPTEGPLVTLPKLKKLKVNGYLSKLSELTKVLDVLVMKTQLLETLIAKKTVGVEDYGMLTEVFPEISVKFPKSSFTIEQSTHNHPEILAWGYDAVYFGKEYQEIKKLINDLHRSFYRSKVKKQLKKAHLFLASVNRVVTGDLADIDMDDIVRKIYVNPLTDDAVTDEMFSILKFRKYLHKCLGTNLMPAEIENSAVSRMTSGKQYPMTTACTLSVEGYLLYISQVSMLTSIDKFMDKYVHSHSNHYLLYAEADNIWLSSEVTRYDKLPVGDSVFGKLNFNTLRNTVKKTQADFKVVRDLVNSLETQQELIEGTLNDVMNPDIFEED